ncbi:5-oxoprolinase subunit PxpA (plasmid) [Pseudorhodobacter turbinis]|uniref:5-oxoprolinase subunit A n=1 Tax=Pseudorhodobacter turbinis TaxID=2500533 RepID=A0A4P8EJD4_9RHOB|nr:5-oxoprolinase subunit PxpA [Pseudorhodobacter turbinis]QCO57079.1 5-oxoprolinase subunit PxpA [Pseudorhodobacter turbinis]
MTLTVDLNADMGEGFGPWVMGDDAGLLPVITSANIACGFHAGDPSVMAATMAAAIKQGVGLGAHPGFADLQGFGRRRLSLSHAELRNMVGYQLGAAQAMAALAGGKLRHLKLHGALANMAAEDAGIAVACFQAARDVAPDIILMAIAATAQQEAAEAIGGPWVAEVFADRAYNDDATLVDRKLPGAVIHDAETAAARMVEMIRAGAIITQSGKHIPTPIDTICLHGDTENAVTIARAVRAALQAAGIGVAQFQGR